MRAAKTGPTLATLWIKEHQDEVGQPNNRAPQKLETQEHPLSSSSKPEHLASITGPKAHEAHSASQVSPPSPRTRTHRPGYYPCPQHVAKNVAVSALVDGIERSSFLVQAALLGDFALRRVDRVRDLEGYVVRRAAQLLYEDDEVAFWKLDAIWDGHPRPGSRRALEVFEADGRPRRDAVVRASTAFRRALAKAIKELPADLRARIERELSKPRRPGRGKPNTALTDRFRALVWGSTTDDEPTEPNEQPRSTESIRNTCPVLTPRAGGAFSRRRPADGAAPAPSGEKEEVL